MVMTIGCVSHPDQQLRLHFDDEADGERGDRAAVHVLRSCDASQVTADRRFYETLGAERKVRGTGEVGCQP